MAIDVPLVAAAPALLARTPQESSARQPAFPAWPFVALGLPIVLRAAIFAVALATQPWTADPNRIIPAWVQLLQASLFSAIALVLLYYGRSDRRAWSLGLFILDAAATLSQPFVESLESRPALVSMAHNLRTDAFQAALLWFFASEFPRPAQTRWLARTFAVATWTALALGGVLAAFDAYAVALEGDTGTTLLALANTVRRHQQGSADWYFTLQFLLLAPLLVLLPLKLRESGPDDRRRFAWLVTGLAVGLGPLIAVAVLPTLSPSLWEMIRPHRRTVGLLVALSLTFVPAAAAYAALVQRTLDLRLVLRAALQYVFARSGVTVLAGLPLLWLAVILFANREQSVGELVTGPEGGVLAALAFLGGAATFARTRVLEALDRAFFREQLDARKTLLGFIDSARNVTTLAGLCEAVSSAVTKALHPAQAGVFVAGENAFHCQDGDLPALLRTSALAQLVEGGDMPFTVDRAAGAVVERLSAPERGWLAASRAALLVPMRGVSGELLGLLALGEKKSELPYTSDDRTLLSAVGSASGLALERVLAKERQGSTPHAAHGVVRAARECVECGTVLEPDALACPCGGLLQRAPVPHVLEDRLRFIQRIGLGGMGVVYRATDLRLQHVRAVKTLLGTTEPATVARLRREARAMAAVSHPNLATLHGLELWRGVPMLVMEFLDGGTLADRLRRGPLPVGQVLKLGITLAEAVGALHAAGILHRDIKPSNIGFTADGEPKLLDFGLARLLARPVTTVTDMHGNDSTLSVSLSMSTDAGIRGTPAYLSPEALSGAPPSPADDVWSLTVTLLEACTGTNPFKAETVPATVARVMTYVVPVADVSKPVTRLFAAALGAFGERPQDATQLASLLKRTSFTQPIQD